MTRYIRYFIAITTCVLVGYLSRLITQESVQTWYPTLQRPFFNPPNWVFMPVWTLLYTLMGFAAGKIWNYQETQDKAVKKALSFFIIQLGLNSLWSYLFFGLHNPFLALIEIVLLWLLIYETYLNFKKIDAIAGKLLLPYLAWVAFATLLNASIWYLNR